MASEEKLVVVYFNGASPVAQMTSYGPIHGMDMLALAHLLRLAADSGRTVRAGRRRAMEIEVGKDRSLATAPNDVVFLFRFSGGEWSCDLTVGDNATTPHILWIAELFGELGHRDAVLEADKARAQSKVRVLPA